MTNARTTPGAVRAYCRSADPIGGGSRVVTVSGGDPGAAVAQQRGTGRRPPVQRLAGTGAGGTAPAGTQRARCRSRHLPRHLTLHIVHRSTHTPAAART